MAPKRSELPASPQAAAIVKHLHKITATGRRPDDIFDDWLQLTEATLDMLPTHARAIAQTGHPAADMPEVAELWSRIRSRYHDQHGVFEQFSEAFNLLFQHAYDLDGTPTYQ